MTVVEGIGHGRIVTWASDPAPRATPGSLAEEQARLARASAVAKRGVAELVKLLPRAEAELFEPELAILDELAARLSSEIGDGLRAEDAVERACSALPTDLLSDARARLLDAIAHDHRSMEGHLGAAHGDAVLVVERLTPSIVASLPACVTAVVAGFVEIDANGAQTSHASILARARDVPLAFVAQEDLAAFRDDDEAIVDATSADAVITIAPSADERAAATARCQRRIAALCSDDARVAEPLTRIGTKILVNLSDVHQAVPSAVEGIGLVRTELLFSDHSCAPSEAEQFGRLSVLATKSRGPIVVRLFDAGGDKPIPWLSGGGDADARGIALLLRHPSILDQQLRAIARIAPRHDVRVLIPYVRAASEVDVVRRKVDRARPVGALIETREALDAIDAIAAAADFVSVGTNDLLAALTGSRGTACALSLDPRLLRAIERVVAAARAHAREVTVCGEIAGDPHAARVLIGLGVSALSVSPTRVTGVKLSLRDVTLDECCAIAREALRAA